MLEAQVCGGGAQRVTMTRAADVALSVARGAHRESLAVGASIRVASYNPGRKGDHSALLKSRQRAAHRC